MIPVFLLFPANKVSPEIFLCSICAAEKHDTDLNKWQPAVQSEQCPGRRHIWQPSCWGRQWNDEECCGAFFPSHGDRILKSKQGREKKKKKDAEIEVTDTRQSGTLGDK